MRLVIYNRFRPEIAHLIGKMPQRTLCGRIYPGPSGPQIIYTDTMRLCEVCDAVMNSTARKIDEETGEYLHG